LLWLSGMVLFILMVITAFLGYILPWGQMSFWAAMVITSLLASLPLIGADLIFLLWGGYTIHDATLHRFYSLHFAFPFLIFIISIIHIIFLHEFGSSNPLGIVIVTDLSYLSPYFLLKDFFGIILASIAFMGVIFYVPDLFSHSINYEMANFLVTPTHIVPEWYFMFFYAILRSITNKILGFVFMVCSVLVLFYLPRLCSGFLIRSGHFKPWHASWFWIFVGVCFELIWIGSLPVMDPFLGIGLYYALFYFLILLVFFPLSGPIEHLVYDAYLLMARIVGNSLCFFLSTVNEIGVIEFYKYVKSFWNFFIKECVLELC